MRVFIAIQLSEEIKKSLITTMHELKKAGVKGSYVPSQNLHMTLCFIGDTTDGSTIRQALEKVQFSPFRLTLTEFGKFGDLLWVGAKGGQKLTALVKDLRMELSEAGVSFDNKKFEPHITLIRKMSGKHASVSVPKTDMMVKGFSLMRSDQKDGKMVYTPIASFCKK